MDEDDNVAVYRLYATDIVMKSFKHLFNIPENLTYLNAAAISPISIATRQAGFLGVGRKSEPWNIKFDNFFTEVEAAKSIFSRLISATPNDIALVPAVSYGLQVAANNIPVSANQDIVILEDQFPSNYYCWKELCNIRRCKLNVVGFPPDYDWTGALQEAITEKTAIVSVPNCHWTDGSLIDLEAVGARCREVGAAFVIDATQSLGAHPLDIKRVQPDFLVCANYKWLLGPYGMAFLYVSPKFQSGVPLEYTPFSKLASNNPAQWFGGKVEYVDAFAEGACRYDCGERANFILLPMIISALEQILDWGVPQIASHSGQLILKLIDACAPLELNHAPIEKLAGHMIGFRFKKGFPFGLDRKLEARNIHISLRGNCMRISPHIYNCEDDITALASALHDILL